MADLDRGRCARSAASSAASRATRGSRAGRAGRPGAGGRRRGRRRTAPSARAAPHRRALRVRCIAEERQVGVGDGVDVGANERVAPSAAAAGRRRGTGRSADRGRRRRRPPADPPRRRRRGPPCRRRASRPSARLRSARPPGVSARTSQPVATRPPAPVKSAASAAATLGKSTTPVFGEWSAATPRRVRLDLAELLGADPAQARDAVGEPAALELVEPRQLSLGSAATITLPLRRAGTPRSSQYS